ncbi:threonine/serine exporter family protein [Kribbella sp. NPDC049584]|uniref:threonine/serine exporter family protein n=1 Tax=Kribbella sp. NPDC049584 TaxID=3154833 RepID=UPI00341A87D0
MDTLRQTIVSPGRDAESFLVEAISVLHANGAESERAERRTRQLAHALGLNARVELGWSWSDFSFGDHSVRGSSAVPSGVASNRVFAVDRIINELDTGLAALADAWERLRWAAVLPPPHLAVFAAACVAGGCGLAVIFGIRGTTALAVIAVCCAAGAFVRRGLAHRGANAYTQSAAAALVAGLGAAISGGAGSAVGLIALCPCLILVPGPHLLNGSLDIAALRIPLGASRLVYAAAVMTAITAGLLVGLRLGQAHLATDISGPGVPLWVEVPTAGFLAVAYGVFYGVPLRVLYWPCLVGGAAHAVRWTVAQTGADAWVGAGLACLFAGLVLVPVCARWQLPFSTIGFASVVSLLPGVLLFRALAGFAQLPSTAGAPGGQLLVETADNASSAALVLLAMALGFLVADAAWTHIRSASSPS